MVLIGFFLFNAELVIYGLKQGKGQLEVLTNTIPVEEALQGPGLSSAEKEKLKLIADVKRYSVDQLGFKESSSYATFHDQKNSPTLWVVTGSEPYRLKPVMWKFPYLGEVSYKGFFDLNAGLAEYAKIKKQGYDVTIGTVGAWSTLGIFSDPVLSGMLKKSKSRLANLIFHELFHTTYYAKSSVDVNENLANFIGHKAATLFLKNDTAELSRYLKVRYDDSLYAAFMIRESKSLDSLYLSFNPKTEKEKIKIRALHRIYNKARRLKLNFPSRYEEASYEILLSKNAYFLEFKRYDELYDSLDRVLNQKYGNDLRAMIVSLRDK